MRPFCILLVIIVIPDFKFIFFFCLVIVQPYLAFVCGLLLFVFFFFEIFVVLFSNFQRVVRSFCRCLQNLAASMNEFNAERAIWMANWSTVGGFWLRVVWNHIKSAHNWQLAVNLWTILVEFWELWEKCFCRYSVGCWQLQFVILFQKNVISDNREYKLLTWNFW